MSEDPVAEFLAREDGALDEELNNVVAAPVVNGFQPNGIQDSHEDSGVDLVGQAGDISPPVVPQTTNGRGASPASSVHSSSNHSHYLTSQEEPESIKKWREQHLKAIKEKDELEEKQKNELREQAKMELEAWHKQKEVEVADRKKQNRIAEEKLSKNLVESQSNGQGWAEIAKLIDIGKPAKNAVDTTRMKALILEHKEETVA